MDTAEPSPLPNKSRVTCILKLGGAAITIKHKFETINHSVLDTSASHLAAAFRQVAERDGPDGGHFIVVHGAGSYGHFQAKEGGVHQGGLGTASVRNGFIATRLSVTQLNHIVVKRLAEEGIPAVGISPFGSGWSTCRKELDRDNVDDVRRALDAGLVPVIHGDAVLDAEQGCAILSGDVIIARLARELRPDRVVFLTNVAGVYDRPPSEEGAVLLREIVVDSDASWQVREPRELSLRFTKVTTSSASHDTTGGMATKIAEAAAVASLNIPVLIAEAGTESALHALVGPMEFSLCQDNECKGTLIRKGTS